MTLASKPAAPQPAPRTSADIPAQVLFQGRQEVRIEHQGEQYRLRITRNGKLILTK